jgi:hypothetical protein
VRTRSCIVLAPLLVEVELLEGRLVARDEQEQRLLGGRVVVLEPGAARNGERVERRPVVALAVDHRITLALERRDQQVRGGAHRQRLLARLQHLGEERDGFEHRLAGGRIDVFDHQAVMRIAVAFLVLREQLAHHLPAVDEHRRRVAGAARLAAGETRHQAAIAVGRLRIVGGEACGLLLLGDELAVLLFLVVVIEVDGVERLDQRQVEDREVERLLVPDGPVVVPDIVRRQHHVAGAEHDVLPVDAGEVALALEPEADRARRMLVRRHDLVGVVEAVGGVHGADRGAARRQARIHQDQRAALAIVHRHQLDRAVEDRLDILGAAPQIRNGFRRRQELLDLVMLHVRRGRPERKHVLGGNVVIERLERDIAVRQSVDIARHRSLLCGSESNANIATPRVNHIQPMLMVRFWQPRSRQRRDRLRTAARPKSRPQAIHQDRPLARLRRASRMSTKVQPKNNGCSRWWSVTTSDGVWCWRSDPET